MMATYDFVISVVGGSFRLKHLTRRMLAEHIETVPVKCYFELEPTNKVDPYAVKVMLSEFIPDANIGYVQRPMNTPLFKLLDERDAKPVKCNLFDYNDAGYGSIDLKLQVDD